MVSLLDVLSLPSCGWSSVENIITKEVVRGFARITSGTGVLIDQDAFKAIMIRFIAKFRKNRMGKEKFIIYEKAWLADQQIMVFPYQIFISPNLFCSCQAQPVDEPGGGDDELPGVELPGDDQPGDDQPGAGVEGAGNLEKRNRKLFLIFIIILLDPSIFFIMPINIIKPLLHHPSPSPRHQYRLQLAHLRLRLDRVRFLHTVSAESQAFRESW